VFRASHSPQDCAILYECRSGLRAIATPEGESNKRNRRISHKIEFLDGLNFGSGERACRNLKGHIECAESLPIGA